MVWVPVVGFRGVFLWVFSLFSLIWLLCLFFVFIAALLEEEIQRLSTSSGCPGTSVPTHN
jgi:hypothetical protein